MSEVGLPVGGNVCTFSSNPCFDIHVLNRDVEEHDGYAAADRQQL